MMRCHDNLDRASGVYYVTEWIKKISFLLFANNLLKCQVRGCIFKGQSVILQNLFCEATISEYIERQLLSKCQVIQTLRRQVVHDDVNFCRPEV